MARPSRNNADYFPHNASFRNDRRVKAIRAQFGITGYGILMMMMEILTDADFIQLDTKDLEMDLLAGDIGVSVAEIHSLLQYAEKIEFFTRNETGHLICPDLNRDLQQVFAKRDRARNAFLAAKERVSVAETSTSVTETTQTKQKKTKQENINSAATAALPPSIAQNDELNGSAREYTLTHKIRKVIEEKFPEYYWDAKDGVHAKKLGIKLKAAVKKRLSRNPNGLGSDPTDSECIDALHRLLVESTKLPPFYQFRDMANLNERFNQIITQIKSSSSSIVNSQKRHSKFEIT